MKKIIISLLLLVICVYCFADIITEQNLIDNVSVANTNKQHKNALKKLFNWYANTNNYQKVISTSKEVLNLKLSRKYKYFVYVCLSNAYLHSNDLGNAVSYAKEAEYLYPKKIEAKKLLASLYKKNNLIELSVEKYQDVLKLYRNEKDALSNLGDISMLQENYKKALEYYQQLEKNYKNIGDNIYYNMAVCYKESGNIKQAENILEQLYNKNKSEQICMLLAKVYQIEEFYKQGQTVLETYVLANKPNVDYKVYVLLSELYLSNKNFEQSKNLLLEFKSIDSSNNEIIDVLLAESYYALNEKEQAETIAKNILKYTTSEKIKYLIENVLKFDKTK